MRAVILAGGRGRRLLPYTAILPKPLIPVGDVPILEIILRQLEKSGFRDITIAVGYLGSLIETYFGNGKKYKLNINYSKEDRPLGTIGALSLINDLNNTFLVINGDVLTTLDFKKLYNEHKKSKAIATVAVKNEKVKIDYGVVKIDKNYQITSYTEKPTLKYVVSMGVYIFEPKIKKFIVANKKLDFPELIKMLIKKRKSVNCYLSKDFWLDLGNLKHYEMALSKFNKMKEKFLR